ncbi:hypothetical protein EYS14_06065 [Alteromonadaceae bacterium M269]|nr:hypothetical protein EYS14_06065 [Alteromonadaceae bacterium M269]
MTTSNQEIMLMEYYGITSERRLVYRYKGYHYNKLDDAINFARLDNTNRIDYNLECKDEEIVQRAKR